MTVKRIDADPRSEDEKKRDEEIIKMIGCCDPEKRRARYAALRERRNHQKNEAAKVGLSLAAWRKLMKDSK